MSVTRDKIDSFHRFAESQIEQASEDLTMEALLDLWRLEHPTPEIAQADLRAVKAALRDIDNGDRGIPFDEHIAQVRAKFNL